MSVLMYTASGLASSALIGAIVGMAGGWLHGSSHVKNAALCGMGVLAVCLAAREWGWITFPLPERKRQTEKSFAHQFGFITASAMWGFHIGLCFVTRITYGGFWLLVAADLFLGRADYGALLMMTYWLGRTLPVWIGPLLSNEGDAAKLMDQVTAAKPIYTQLVGLSLLWSAIVMLLVGLRPSIPMASKFFGF
jgi:hypothetical protein